MSALSAIVFHAKRQKNRKVASYASVGEVYMMRCMQSPKGGIRFFARNQQWTLITSQNQCTTKKN